LPSGGASNKGGRCNSSSVNNFTPCEEGDEQLFKSDAPPASDVEPRTAVDIKLLLFILLFLFNDLTSLIID
jgi:hypothetical protein